MRFWHHLRWQIVAAQLLVVVVGVVTLLVTADVLAQRAVAPPFVPAFRAALGPALAVAATAATAAGLATSLVLARTILRPLRSLAQGSRRIAAGHYDERVRVPTSDELADVAASFNHMASVLQTVEQQRVALIGNVAHELRTPLAGLEGYLEGLVDGVLPSDPATLHAMQHEVRRLRRLVDDLQQLSRLEAGAVALQPAAIDLDTVAQRVAAQLQPQLLGQQMVVVPAATPVLVWADPDRTAQILINLVGNAIRYTPAPGRITVRVAAAGGQGQVVVADTGIGIPPAALPYVFERFYRVDPSRARSSGGSGIGLTIARHLARAMGGDLTAASAGPGEGSTFALALPQQPPSYNDRAPGGEATALRAA